MQFCAREALPDGDQVSVRIVDGRTATITAGIRGTAPLYLATWRGALVASWDPADLVFAATPECISPVVVARLLTRRHRYAAETVFTSIRRLTAGATAIYRGGQRVQLPCLPPWLGERSRDAMALRDVDVSPVTQVALPTLVVFAARHPAYLRAGLWPVAPLSHPVLSEFGRSLHAEWRADKRLMRARLTRAGLPRQVTRPRQPESFSSIMQLALQRHGRELLLSMLDKSVLIGNGFVDRPAVERLRRHAAGGYPLPPMVYDMLALEIGIRSMVEHQQGELCNP